MRSALLGVPSTSLGSCIQPQHSGFECWLLIPRHLDRRFDHLAVNCLRSYASSAVSSIFVLRSTWVVVEGYRHFIAYPVFYLHFMELEEQTSGQQGWLQAVKPCISRGPGSSDLVNVKQARQQLVYRQGACQHLCCVSRPMFVAFVGCK